MRRIITFFIAMIFLVSISMSVAAASADSKYITEICTIKLSEALKERYLDENNNKVDEEVELIPYVEKQGAAEIVLSSALHNVEFTNPQILINDKKIELYKKQYFAALSKAVAAEAAPSRTDTALRKQELLDWRVKLNSLQNLQYDRDALVYNKKIELEKNYISGSQLQEDKKIMEKELEKLEQKIKQSELKLKLGLIKTSELEDLTSSRYQLETQLKSTDRQLAATFIKIKQALGLDMDKEIALVASNRQYSAFDEGKLEERIEKAAEASHEIELVNRNLDLAKLEYDIVTTYYEGDYPAQADSLEASIQSLEDSIITTKLNLKATLWNSYFSLKNQEDNIEIQRINIKLLQRDLGKIKAKLKLDQANAGDELAAEIELSKSENKLQALINEYMIAQEGFNRSIDEAVK